MQNVLRQTGQTTETLRLIQVADELRHPQRMQCRVAAAHQGQDAIALQQLRQGAPGDIAAADNQQVSHGENYRMTFRITIEPSGHSCQAKTWDTLLQAALDAGLTLPYGCRNGACGACKGKILSGEIDHGNAQEHALSAAEREAGMALFCCATAQSDVVIECRELRAVGEIPVKTLPCRVHKMQHLAADVMLLQLKLPTNERLQFLPGQYIDILLREGRRRAFSLANAPHDDEFLQLHIRRIAGGEFTTHVFETMKERDILRLEGPHGTFQLREDTAEDKSKPVIFVAGSTGFAPIKAMVEHAIHHGVTRPMEIYWGARDRAGLYLAELPLRWAAEQPHIAYSPVLSEPIAEDHWGGRTGLVHQAVLADHSDLSGHQIYVCGAPAMVDAARRDFMARGLPTEKFFADAFSFAADAMAVST
jgi:CDP-4-dehydro-6-deoxyglucose reductase